MSAAGRTFVYTRMRSTCSQIIARSRSRFRPSFAEMQQKYGIVSSRATSSSFMR